MAILSARAMGAETLRRPAARLSTSLDVVTEDPAPSPPPAARALGFQPGITMHRDVTDWARLGLVECDDDRHLMRCREVYVPAVAQRYDQVDFRFDNRGRLLAVTARRVVGRPEIADAHLSRLDERLEAQLGRPDSRSSEASHHHRFGRSFARYESAGLAAEVVTTNFCCRGVHIVERYRATR